ncbi:MAG: TetR/AcrR family transcriptional regulator [Actinomycetota bacterium]
MPKISARTLEEHRAETLERLIDGFAELVMSRGFAAVSLADVAAHAGLARTAIYNYFPDREALLFAWTEREVARAINLLRESVAEATTCSDKLCVFIMGQLEGFGTRHLPPGQEVMQFLRPEIYQSFMTHIEPIERLLFEIISEGLESKEFQNVDPKDAVQLIMACIGSERAPLASGMHSIDEAAERVTQFVLRALGAEDAAKI